MSRVGKFDTLISIQSKSDTENDFGEPIASWSEFASVWAQRRDVSGKEAFEGGRMESSAMVKFMTRSHVDNVTTAMSVLVDSDRYNIMHVAQTTKRRRGLELTCRLAGP